MRRKTSGLIAELFAVVKEAEDQERLAHIADVAIENYAMESAWLRAARRGNTASGPVKDIVDVYANDAADRIRHSARQVRSIAIPEREPIDSVGARRRIADAVIRAGKYVW